MSEKKVSVTLVKSPIGRIPKHVKTLRALGLRKIGARRTHSPGNPAVAGMIKQVEYLLKIEDA